jgi:hypothetical protein
MGLPCSDINTLYLPLTLHLFFFEFRLKEEKK